MGDVVDPKFPQWRHKNEEENAVPDDRVIATASKLLGVLVQEHDNRVTQLAALLLLQRTLLSIIQTDFREPTAREAMRQARELADGYMLIGTDGFNHDI